MQNSEKNELYAALNPTAQKTIGHNSPFNNTKLARQPLFLFRCSKEQHPLTCCSIVVPMLRLCLQGTKRTHKVYGWYNQKGIQKSKKKVRKNPLPPPPFAPT